MTEEFSRTDVTTQRLIASMTFEELITGQNGVAVSRALVNVIIDQQIGQQIAVSNVVLMGLVQLDSMDIPGGYHQRYSTNSMWLIL